jgi:hypothetical protein
LEQKIKYEQKLIADLKEYSDRPETTVLDGITSVLAEILVRLDALDERAVRTENSLDLLWQRYQLLAKYLQRHVPVAREGKKRPHERYI